MRIKFTGFLVFFVLISQAATAADAEKKKAEEKPEKKIEEKSSVTEHTAMIGGKEIKYTATAGTIRLDDEEELKAEASVFYVAYTKKSENPEQAKQDRPVAFCFNGGPGSSAVWLHLGGLGPKRVHLTDEGMLPPPPFRLKDNAASILDVTDLVFIDPVSTGYSRAAKKEKVGEFHGFEGDLKSVSEAVRLYVHRNGRWLSPKYLIGESYGALRVSGLSLTLQKRYGMYLNGIVLVSGVLDFKTLWGDDLSYICFLPALADVAAWHGKLDKELVADMDAFRTEVETFARDDYATALLLGARLDEAKRKEVIEKLAAYTSLDPALIDRNDLRIDTGLFREELLKSEGKVIGRFDGRVTGSLRSESGDPSYDVVYGPFASTMKHYVSQDLKFESDTIYEILTRKVHPWDYKNFSGESIKSTPHLAEALAKNPYLKVLVNCGRQDLATPGFSIQQSLDQLSIAPELHENIRYTYYEGGHMMYTIEESNTAWNNDIRNFIEETKTGAPAE
ncbi:MAG: peptidase S10 [Verrucomicrobiales bacterium]|nr:peptidase S10 [Verrucomicrobiales bacterium]